METYSGELSSPSRELEFENPPTPPPLEDEQHPQSTTYKVKFMCSYGGKIHPRPHDNHLSYVGGETKILAVDQSIKFSALLSKLSALCDADVCFKYQLPGEDLDALISVTNDDDLEHLMHEYDLLYRISPHKPVRLRLFLFLVNPNQNSGSNEGRSDRERFVDALNSGPVQSPPPLLTVAPINNVDLLFGMEKGMPPPPQVRDSVMDSEAVAEPEGAVIGSGPVRQHIQDLQNLQIGDDRTMYRIKSEDNLGIPVIGSDPIQQQDLQKLQIGDNRTMYRIKSDDNLVGDLTGDFYGQKMPEKVAPMPLPVGYWPENQIPGGYFPATTLGSDQSVYMIPSPASMYHAPIGRPMTGQTCQGYYTVQRMPPEVYREQPVYNVMPPAPSTAAAQPTLPPLQKMAGFQEMVRSTTSGGVGVADTGYAQVAYDGGVGRQVYYNAPGGVVQQQTPPQTQYQGIAAAAAFGGDMRSAGTFNQEGGKVVSGKISQTSG